MILMPLCGAAPPFDQLAFVEKGHLGGEEAADTVACIDESEESQAIVVLSYFLQRRY